MGEISLRVSFLGPLPFGTPFTVRFISAIVYEADKTCPPIRGLRNLRLQCEQDRQRFFLEDPVGAQVFTEQQKDVFTCSLYASFQMDSSSGLTRRWVLFLVHFTS